MSGEIDRVGSAVASNDEIMALCREFPDAPVIEIMRHAIAHGGPLTRQRLVAGHTSLSISDTKESLMRSATSETAALPTPNGMSSALGLPDAIEFRIAVDAEIARLKNADEPAALWLEELLSLYAAGMPPAEAARQVVAKRYPQSVHRRSARRRRGLFKLLLDGWREWDFQRSLRLTGRA